MSKNSLILSCIAICSVFSPTLAGEKTTERRRFIAPEMTKPRTDVKPFEYLDVGPKIPNYIPGAKWGTLGNAKRLMQKPLPAEESLKHFVTPVGFRMELFAADPQIGGNPMAIDWDERGRLWVCETADYPNKLQSRGKGNDRIRICEDTDGDGRADKFTLFADGLSIPTALTFYRGGVIVQSGTQTLFLKDTDGDDKADLRRVLISNWNMGDTHGGVSNFSYGLDNWIWAMQGYNPSSPVIDGKRQQSFRMGFFRFKLDDNDPPNVTEIEFLRSTNNNTWGLGISEDGIVFGSTANHNPSVYMPIPNRYYERVRGWAPAQLGTIADSHLFKPITKKVRQVDHHGGYTAGAGHSLYTARVYPQQWWNRTAFVCGPTGHLVGTFVLQANGADFRSTSPCNLVASDDEWTAPIMAKVGPDGNVWIVDWYNYIVQHNPTPRGFRTGKGNAYISDLRDTTHGRIYRLVYTGKQHVPSNPPKALDPNNANQLVATLKHPTMLWRKHAQRLLIERGKTDVTADLIKLVQDQTADAIGLNVGAIHALWTMHGLGLLDENHSDTLQTVYSELRHPSAGVRRNAVLVLPPSEKSLNAILESSILKDDDAQVRLAALLALADMPHSEKAGGELASLLKRKSRTADRWLQDALTSAAATHALPFLKSLAEAESTTTVKRDAHAVVAIVAEHVARGRPSAETVQSLLASLGKTDSRLVETIASGLIEGWPSDHKITLSKNSDQILEKLVDGAPRSVKGRVFRLASLWNSSVLEKRTAQIVTDLLQSVANAELSDKARIAAASQLIGLRPKSDEAARRLLDQITPQTPPGLSKELLDELRRSDAEKLGSMLAERMPKMTPTVRSTAIGVMLARPQTTMALLNNAATGKLSLSELKLDQQAALRSHPNTKIRRLALKLLKAQGNLPNPDREKVLVQLLPLTKKTGDVERGRLVFKKNCANCHRHNGEGENIGPDLTGMAVHPKEELLTHIIDPSRSVEGNFRSYTVLTKQGRFLTGMLAGESRTTLEIVDNQAKRTVLQRDDIDKLLASKKSVMPDGFEKQITNEQLVDLLEFLTNTGKYVPLPLSKVATAISTKGLFHEGDSGPDRLILPEWKAKVVEGVPFLPVDPRGKTTPNIILLYGPRGTLPPKMPKSVRMQCNTAAKAIHLLSGISGWGYPAHRAKTVSMTVRLHYKDGATEDHPLRNGIHFADYIRRIDVPKSQFAFDLRGRQIRYLAIEPKRRETIEQVEFLTGDDPSSPIIMAVTVERTMKE